MLRKFKLSVCCIMTLVLLFTFTTASAFADTKTVTVSTTSVFISPGPEIGGIIQNIQSSTYNYDDGTYRGVLSYLQLNSVNVVPVSNSPGVLQVTVSVTYSGTVTSYSPPLTKTVNVTDYKTFTCEGSQANANMQAIQNSTYYYNDGTYHGTLSFYRIVNVQTTVVSQGPAGVILQFYVTVEYSGTVTT
ncbi:MAG TPA: hypothetical protein VN258_16940 [Mobilitalea sp.]|nr:hypothetical protein [Mobilitalea sp.]